jgi:hypothetical protein
MLKPDLSAVKLTRLVPSVTPHSQIKTGLRLGKKALELRFQNASKEIAWREGCSNGTRISQMIENEEANAIRSAEKG